MDFVIPPGLKDIGLGGLALLGLLFIALGKLIPRSVHLDRVTDLKEQLKEKDAQIAHLQTALNKRDEQIDKVLNDAQTGIRVMEAIQREAAGKA